MKEFKIGFKSIGGDNPCFIIAEIGTNHNRDINTAKRLIEAAKKSGCDGVKFQIYHPSDIVHKKIRTSEYHYENVYSEKYWYEVLEKHLATPRSWFPELIDYVRKLELTPIATCHCENCAKFMFDNGIDAFKVASMDITHFALMKEVARFGKPLILATGMSTADEIKDAVRNILETGNNKLALLHCVSNYPSRAEELNLNNIKMLLSEFDLPVGFSDHSKGTLSASTAVAIGAKLIEKHITLDRNSKGPDHHFALEPHELQNMVEQIREVERSLGDFERELGETENKKRDLYRRSVIAGKNITKGERISESNVIFARPGNGVSPKDFESIKDKKANRNISESEQIQWADLE
jgi:sialic acid synthase SpsE